MPVVSLVKNYSNTEITPEFIVLHHTGVSLNATFNIFNQDNCGSAHLVIDLDGTIYECVPCWHGRALRAWHAGVSKLDFCGQAFENFNDFSIGIELVNLNGNFYNYTSAQYKSLESSITHLIKTYPVLNDPNRILSHQQIAGFRGKCDPGILFDWNQIFMPIFGSNVDKQNFAPNLLISKLGEIYKSLPEQLLWKEETLATSLSSLCELTSHFTQTKQAELLAKISNICQKLAEHALNKQFTLNKQINDFQKDLISST